MYRCGISGCKHTTQTLEAMFQHEHEHVINKMGDTIQDQAARIAALEAELETTKKLLKRDSEHLLEVGAQNAKLIAALDKLQRRAWRLAGREFVGDTRREREENLTLEVCREARAVLAEVTK